MPVAYLSVVQLIFLGVIAAGAHWIVARSEIARPLWSRAGGRLGDLLACAGCSGFWLGLGLGFVGLRPFCTDHLLLDVLITGILGTWVTPVFETLLLWGLRGSALEDEGADTGGGDSPEGDQPLE